MNTQKGFIATIATMAITVVMGMVAASAIVAPEAKTTINDNLDKMIQVEYMKQPAVFYAQIPNEKSGTLPNGLAYSKGFIDIKDSKNSNLHDTRYPMWMQGTTLIIAGYEIPYIWLYGHNYIPQSADEVKSLYQKFKAEKDSYIKEMKL